MLNRNYNDRTLRRLSPFRGVRMKPASLSISRRSLVSQLASVYMRNARKNQHILSKLLQLPALKPRQICHRTVQVGNDSYPAKFKALPRSSSNSLTKQKTPRVMNLFPQRSDSSSMSSSAHIQDVVEFSNDDRFEWERDLDTDEEIDPLCQSQDSTNQQLRSSNRFLPIHTPQPARLFQQSLEEQPVQQSMCTYLASSVSPMPSIRIEDEMDTITVDPTECSCQSCQAANAKQLVGNDCHIPPPQFSLSPSNLSLSPEAVFPSQR